MELTDPSKDHVIPVTALGGMVRENIVPTNRGINCSKNNHHMIEWFESQEFFCQKRLNKILEWMGDYADNLYNNQLTARHYEEYKNKSTINFYTIIFPNGEKRKMYYPYHGNPKRRTLDLQTVLDTNVIKYCNDNWITFNDKNYFNSPEDKTKRFLESCANFLLARGSYLDDIHLTKIALNKIFDNEIHLDSYVDNDEDVSTEEIIELINKHVQDLYKGDGNILLSKGEREKQACQDERRQPTKFDKYEMIFGCDEKLVTKYKNKNKPFFPDYWVVEDVKIPKTKGLINKDIPYKSEWCTVSVDYQFTFNGNTYTISDSVLGYRECGHTKRYDTYRDDYSMDKILVFEQEGKMFFFDQNIDKIDNKYIT